MIYIFIYTSAALLCSWEIREMGGNRVLPSNLAGSACTRVLTWLTREKGEILARNDFRLGFQMTKCTSQ